MHPVWILFLGALLGQVVGGSFVDPSARVVALAAATVLLLAPRQRRALLLLGLLLGLWAGWRAAAPAREANSWSGQDGDAFLELMETVDRGRARCWIAREGLEPVQALISGLGDEARRGWRGHAELRLWLLPSRRNFDDRHGGRSALGRRILLRGKVEGEVEWSSEDALPDAPVRQRLRDGLRNHLRASMGASADLWMALLAADREGLDPAAAITFRRLGLAHLLALSGLHVSLVAGLVWWLARRWFGPGSWLPLLPVIAWACLAGWGASLSRALGMLIYVTAARRLHRPLHGESALAAVGLVELVVRPWSPSLLGWCLSYAATLGLLRISKLISRRRLVLFALAAPIVAQLATLPWALSAFGQISRVSVPANLLVAPVFGVFMLAGVGLVLISLLIPPLAPMALSLLAMASHLFGFLLQLMNRFAPEPWGHPGIGGWCWTVAMVISAVMLLPGLPLPAWARGWFAVGLLVAVHVPTMLTAELSWTTLDVGQGDAAVLRARRSHWLVVDAGPAGFGYDAGERVVLPYLQRRNARDVSLLLSHGHLDHYGGTSSLLASGRIDRLLLAASERDRDWTLPLLEKAEAAACEIVWLARGDTLTLGELKLHCLWPPHDEGDFGSNDRSLVLRGGPVGREFLITGDLELEGELALLARRDSISAAVLKVAHHGSETGTSDLLLERLGGRWALISCGVGNRYGHPGPRTMGRLEAAGWELLRTDERGAIRLRWRPSAIEMRSARRSP